MSKYEFLIPYVLESPIFPKSYIEDVKLMDGCFIKILEIYLNRRISTKNLSYLNNFYNATYTEKGICVRFLIPNFIHFLCDILKKCGTDMLSTYTYKLYVDFWNKKTLDLKKSGVYFFILLLPNQNCYGLLNISLYYKPTKVPICLTGLSP